MILEIHQPSQNNQSTQQTDWIIKIFYLNVTESESPYELELKDCTDDEHNDDRSLKMNNNMALTNNRVVRKVQICTLTNFRRMISDLIPDNWEEECENTATINTDGNNNNNNSSCI